MGGLLAINLLVLTYYLMRKSAPAPHVQQSAQVQPGQAQPAQEQTTPSSAQIAAPTAPQTPAHEHFSPLDAAPVYAPEIPVTATEATPDKPVSHAARRADPLLSDADTEADNQEVLPSISEISLSGAQALPDLHLDVHVYATKPADRFVYINMRKYHEGAALQEGPTVERIRRDGVLLNYQGVRFILPRQP